ncbi:MAG: tetratricopeptide repeat protein [Pseudomonadota bacterium]
MKTHSIAVLFALVAAIIAPAQGIADQTDERLPALFETLRSTTSETIREETEDAIWTIWFASGSDEIDRMMEEARQAVQAGELRAAELIYSEVIEKAPLYSEGWNRRATVRYYQRDFDGSLDDIEQTLALEPRHFGAIWGMGMILGLQKNFPNAIAAFERLLEIKPNARDARPRIELLKQEMNKGAV